MSYPSDASAPYAYSHYFSSSLACLFEGPLKLCSTCSGQLSWQEVDHCAGLDESITDFLQSWDKASGLGRL